MSGGSCAALALESGTDNEIKSAVPGLVGESVIVLIRDNAIAFERCRLLLESDILGMPSV